MAEAIQQLLRERLDETGVALLYDEHRWHRDDRSSRYQAAPVDHEE